MRTIVITGGSKGLGAALVKKFLDKGDFVISASRSGENEVRSENLVNFKFDATVETQHNKLMDFAISNSGKLDVFINNAGFSEWRPIEKVDQSFLESIFALNVFGYFYGAKYASQVIPDGGSIINISSLASKRGTPNNSAYVATKFAINGLTQSLCKELGKRGIRVNAINPVLIETPGLILALENTDSPAKGDPKSFLQDFSLSQTALGRLPTAAEVANLAYFLSSNEASGITGQSINVDCGVLPN